MQMQKWLSVLSVFLSTTVYASFPIEFGTTGNSFTAPNAQLLVSAQSTITATAGPTTQAYDVKWIATPITATGACTTLQFDPTFSWTLGTNTIPAGFSNTNTIFLNSTPLSGLLNVGSLPMHSGAYCLWAYVVAPTNHIALGKFYLQRPTDVAANVTYTYESSENFFTRNVNIISMNAVLYNNSFANETSIVNTTTSEEWVYDGQNWIDTGDVWVEDLVWVSDSVWVEDYVWIEDYEWVSDWVWIDTGDGDGYWEDYGYWVDYGYWSDYGYWVDNGYYVDNGYWQSTGYWEDYGHYETVVTNTYLPGIDLRWYLTASLNGNCAGMGSLTGQAHLVASQAIDHLNGYSDLTAQGQFNLQSVQNGNLQAGVYCLWAKALPRTGTRNNSNFMIYHTPIVYGTPTGIKSIKTQPLVQVFPNPTTDEIRAKLPASVQSKVKEIQIMNTQGQVVRTQKVEKGNETISVQVSDLPSGVYLFLVVADGVNIKASRFVKN